MYIRRLTYVPALSKEADLRRLLEERAHEEQAKGRQVALYEQAVPPQGTTYVVEDIHAQLEELAAWRQQLRVDAGVAEFRAKLATLLLHPPSIALFEVLVPFPPKP